MYPWFRRQMGSEECWGNPRLDLDLQRERQWLRQEASVPGLQMRPSETITEEASTSRSPAYYPYRGMWTYDAGRRESPWSSLAYERHGTPYVSSQYPPTASEIRLTSARLGVVHSIFEDAEPTSPYEGNEMRTRRLGRHEPRFSGTGHAAYESLYLSQTYRAGQHIVEEDYMSNVPRPAPSRLQSPVDHSAAGQFVYTRQGYERAMRRHARQSGRYALEFATERYPQSTRVSSALRDRSDNEHTRVRSFGSTQGIEETHGFGAREASVAQPQSEESSIEDAAEDGTLNSASTNRSDTKPFYWEAKDFGAEGEAKTKASKKRKTGTTKKKGEKPDASMHNEDAKNVPKGKGHGLKLTGRRPKTVTPEQKQRIFEGDMKVYEELGVSSYSCFVCPREDCFVMYTRKPPLTRHIATHDGLRYECPKCGTLFTRKDNLKIHISNRCAG